MLYLTTVISVINAANTMRTEFPGLIKDTIFRCACSPLEFLVSRIRPFISFHHVA